MCQDSHIALDEDEPDKPTDGISPEEKAYGREVIVYASWLWDPRSAETFTF